MTVVIGKPKLCTKFEIARFSHCINIKGEPQIFGSSPEEATPTFVFRCDFIIGLGKPKLCTKFKLASFSHYRNINRDPQILRNFRSPELRPLFLLGGILWWATTNPSCMPNLKSLALAVAEILKGNPIIWGAPLVQGHTHFSSGCNFMIGLGRNTQTAYQISSRYLQPLEKY